MPQLTVKRCLTFFLVLAVGLVAGTAYRLAVTPYVKSLGVIGQPQASLQPLPQTTPQVRVDAPAASTAASAGFASASSAASAAAPAIIREPLQAITDAVRLRATVLVAGAAHAASEGRIALPTGTRFQLQLDSNQAGTLELHANAPEGGSEPLWLGDIHANEQVETPILRLAGTHGLETLYLVLRTSGQGVIGRQRVEIWHL